MTKDNTPQKKSYDELFEQSNIFIKDFARSSKDGYNSWLYFLKNHKDYDAGFWSQEDADGRHVLVSLLESHGPSVLHVWDDWRAETKDALFEKQDKDGALLMHAIWRSVETSVRASYRNNFDFFRELREAQEKTPPEHWTFLDKKIDHPGEGWLNALMRVNTEDYSFSKQKKEVEKITTNIVTQFPQNPDPSWWFTCKNSLQISNLLSRGLSLNDEVSVGSVKMPFVDWVFSSPANYKIRSEIIKAKILSPEEEKRLSDQDKKFDAIVPKDRRSSVGYIKQIFAFKDQDSLGRSSFDYCIAHRPDLTHLLCNAIYNHPAEIVKGFCSTDKNGFSFATRAELSLGQSDFNDLKRAIESKGIPFELNSKECGWFALEYNHRHWIKSLSRYSSTRSLSEFRYPSVSAEEMFGTLIGQQKLIDFWEDNFEKAIFALERSKSSALKRSLLRQAVAWYNFSIANKAGDTQTVHEGLESLYKVALWCLHGTPKQPDLGDHWTGRMSMPSHNFDFLIPEVFSPAIREVVLTSDFFNPEKKAYMKDDVIKMRNLATRAQLLASVETENKRASLGPRKM